MQIFWLIKGLRTGRVTTRYPAVPETLPAGFRGSLTFDPTRCRAEGGCDACVEVCLPRALSLDLGTDAQPWRFRLNLGGCLACGLCVDACPNCALELSPDYELAVRKPEDLWLDLTFNHESECEDNGD